MKDQYILHLQAGGYPMVWSLVAIYDYAYGIAHNSADSWYKKSTNSRQEHGGVEVPPGSPQFLIEIDRGVVKRQDIWFDFEYYSVHQSKDDVFFVQFNIDVELPNIVKDLAFRSLKDKLIELEFLIPRPLWEEKYPEQKALQDEFNRMMKEHSHEADI